MHFEVNRFELWLVLVFRQLSEKKRESMRWAAEKLRTAQKQNYK